MATFQVFKLRPDGAFHFGAGGIGVEETRERCPSDTLYAALLMEARLGGLPFPEPQADGTLGALPFRLSSCFPYAGGTLLFPLPQLAPRRQTTLGQGQRKRIKHIRYISVTVLRHILNGGSLLDLVPSDEESGSSTLVQGGAALIANVDDPRLREPNIWEIQRVDHVTVDRERQSSQYYAVGQVRFAPTCGLYVLAQVADDATSGTLHELLTRLGHAGLGGRRSKGLGQFTVESPITLDLPDSTGTGRAMLLSRYLPTRAELDAGVLGPGASYDLAQISGWLQSNDGRVRAQQRKSIYLVGEGSVIRTNGAESPTGRVADVRPDGDVVPHPVWRYGLALTIGVTAEEVA